MIRLEIATRMLLTGVVWAAGTVAILLVLVLAAPKLVGGQSFAVLSDSMHGAVDTGDEVVVLKQPASEIEPGQIVAFNDPEGTGKLFQHRVQRVDQRAGWIEVVTKGDANTASESWRTAVDSDVGRVVLVVPKAGFLLGKLGDPDVRTGVLGVPAVLVAVLMLIGIWRRPKEIEFQDV